MNIDGVCDGDILLLDDMFVTVNRLHVYNYWSVILINFNKTDLLFCELILKKKLERFWMCYDLHSRYIYLEVNFQYQIMEMYVCTFVHPHC